MAYIVGLRSNPGGFVQRLAYHAHGKPALMCRGDFVMVRRGEHAMQAVIANRRQTGMYVRAGMLLVEASVNPRVMQVYNPAAFTKHLTYSWPIHKR